MTYAPPNEVAGRGVVQVPGGQGVFPTLTVAEHLRLAGWLHRTDKARVDEATEHVLELFPILRDRLDEPAGNLSGGQQQMLALGMAFIEQPRLLMIDELSLGLAPAIVEQLLPIVRDISAQGTTIILVEQSVNLALDDRRDRVLHGEGRDPLPRPDRRAARAPRRAAFGVPRRRGQGHGRRPSRRPAPRCRRPPRRRAVDGNGAERRTAHAPTAAPVRLGARRRVEALRRARRADRRVVHARRAARSSGSSARTARARPRSSTSISGFLARRRRHDHPRRRRPTRSTSRALSPAARAPSSASAARSRTGGCSRTSPSPRRSRSRSNATSRSRDPVAAALRLPWVDDTEHDVDENVERLLELLGITDFRDKLVRELSTGSRRIVDLACVARARPVGAAARRAVVGHRAARGRGARPAAAAHPRTDGATLLVIEHDVPLLLGIADRLVALDLGEIVAEGAPDEVVNDPRVVHSYLGTTEAAIARSGSRTVNRQTDSRTAIDRTGGTPDGHATAHHARRSDRRGCATRRSSRSSSSSRSSPSSSATREQRRQEERRRSNVAGSTDAARPARTTSRSSTTTPRPRATLDKYTWQDNCDTTTGRVAIPILDPPPCVAEVHRRQRRRDVARRHRRHDQDRLLHRQARPASTTRSLKATGAYDPPDETAQGVQGLRRDLREPCTSSTAARSSSCASTAPAARPTRSRRMPTPTRAAADGVFAVIGGPAQAQAVLRRARGRSTSCASARASSPSRRSTTTTTRRTCGRPARRPTRRRRWSSSSSRSSSSASPRSTAGPDVQGQDRARSRCSRYDTPDGQFKASWDDLEHEDEGRPAPTSSTTSNYYLEPRRRCRPTRARSRRKLKQASATEHHLHRRPDLPAVPHRRR